MGFVENEGVAAFGSDAERLKKVLSYLSVTGTELAKRCGMRRPDTIYRTLRGERPLTRKTALLICDAHPHINLAWLLTGEGKMLNESETAQIARDKKNAFNGAVSAWQSASSEISALSDRIALLEQIIRDKDAIIALLTDQLKNR